MDHQPEIMVELTEEDMKDLMKIYKPYEDSLPHIQSLIQNCINSKIHGFSSFMKIMSPNSCWKEDGTFFAVLLSGYGHDIFVHSLDQTGKNIKQGLLNTKVLHFPQNEKRPFSLFYSIKDAFAQPIIDILTLDLKANIQFRESYSMYALRKEEALKFNIQFPPDVEMKAIAPKDVGIINEVWPNKYPGSAVRLKELIELNEGYGVYLRSTGQLVSWVVISLLGQLCALQTAEDQMKKGYGSLVVKYTSKKLAEKGFHTFATIQVGNKSSEALFEKLGFKVIGMSEYFGTQIL